jgi:hypothetical protein
MSTTTLKTRQVGDNQITYAKVQQVTNNRLLGNVSGGTANVAEVTLDTDGTLAANSDSVIATQKAVKTYVTANAGGGNNPLMVQIFS